MKKIMTAALGLSLLTGTAVFAQNASTDTSTAKAKKSHKKKKKDTADTTSTAK